VLEVEAGITLDGTKIGDSISVNGVCLTVVRIKAPVVAFDVMPETFRLTGLSGLHPKEAVNLERSLKVGGRMGGHFVSGHVDCAGTIRRKQLVAGNLCVEVAVPAKLMCYAVPRGSVAVDGISLTIVDRKPAGFTVYIIPHTVDNTTLRNKGVGDRVNVEFDMLAKTAVEACRRQS
jgi:riboflavin synthase